MIEGLRLGFGIFGFCFIVGAGLALGFALICRLMKWAPMNIVVNVDQTHSTD